MGLQSASGGLTKSKLALATAVPGDVVAGKTFYAGDKELQTGSISNKSAHPDAYYTVDYPTPLVVCSGGATTAVSSDGIKRTSCLYYGERICVDTNTLFGVPAETAFDSCVSPSVSQWVTPASVIGSNIVFQTNHLIERALVIGACARGNSEVEFYSAETTAGTITPVAFQKRSGNGQYVGLVVCYAKNIPAGATITFNWQGAAICGIVAVCDLLV